MHELLLIASECFAVLCIFNSRLPSSFINKVDIYMPEVVLRSFIICLDIEEAHGDFWGEDDHNPIHRKERCSSDGLTGRSLVTP
jgi:hypothetical protein